MRHSSPRPEYRLSRSGSVLLDVLRFGAACTVLVSHFGHAGLSMGFPDLTAAGHLAVAVFFVLSGFVIRYVTLTRESTAREYLIDRASRIYSVVVPALVITVMCEIAARTFFPRVFAGPPLPWRELPLQLGANLIFQAQDWGYEIGVLSNDVFWSLSFECLYYAVYGLWFYRVPRRGLFCFLLLLIAGPSIVLMFPVWLLGCFAFDAYQKLRRTRAGVYFASFTFAGLLGVFFLERASIRDLAIATNEAHRTEWLSRFLLQLPHHEYLFVGGRVPWLARASLSFVLVGLLTATFTICALLLLDSPRWQIPARVAGGIRVVADSTFALYLLHLPLLIIIVCAVGRPIQGWWSSAIVLMLVILACVGLAIPFDALKRHLRSRMEAAKTVKAHLVRG